MGLGLVSWGDGVCCLGFVPGSFFFRGFVGEMGVFFFGLLFAVCFLHSKRRVYRLSGREMGEVGEGEGEGVYSWGFLSPTYCYGYRHCNIHVHVHFLVFGYSLMDTWFHHNTPGVS